MDETDFDISNYTEEELVNILGLGGKIPLTNEDVVERIKEMTTQFENKYEEDEELINICAILRKNSTIPDNVDREQWKYLKTIYFNPNDVTDTNGETKDADIWGEWSNSEKRVEFENNYNDFMENDGFFNEFMIGKIEANDSISDGDKYYEAIQNAFDAKEMFLIFFDKIANKLKAFRKDEMAVDYNRELEENEKSLLEGDFMDENEKILSNGTFTQPIWERTNFVNNQTPSFPSDYKNPLLQTSMTKVIHIDSKFRTIPDALVCLECPDTLEFNQNISNGGTLNPVVASNNNGTLLIAGISGKPIYILGEDVDDNGIQIWTEISDLGNNGNSQDATMSYNGNNIALCVNDSYIWCSNDSGKNESWVKGINSTTSNDITGHWKAITSDFTGSLLYVIRDSTGGDFTTKGICISEDAGITWTDISGNGSIADSDFSGLTYNLQQNWKDIVVTGDGKKVYAIYERSNKYYIIQSINKGRNWTILNAGSWDYSTNTELVDYQWKQIVTNFYGTKIFIIAEDTNYIWRSFNGGEQWSKISEPSAPDDKLWHSITCSMDGLNVAVWNKNGMQFSKNGGTSWNEKYSTVTVVDANISSNAKITISHDGDRILGLTTDGNIFTSKKCKVVDNKLFDRASNFTLNLSESLKNVISLSFKNIKIPHSWYVFNKNEGTNLFWVKKPNDTAILLEIPEGNYHYNNDYGEDSNVVYQLNKCIGDYNSGKNTDNKIDISFNYIGFQHKIAIKNNSSTNITIYWYYENSSESICGFSGDGPRINYNLGWLLGFRKTLLVIGGGNQKKMGTALVDLKGTRSVYISLDEFSNNKSPDTCVTFENNIGSFNMPSYYVKTTMGPEAIKAQNDPNNKCYVKPEEKNLNCGSQKSDPIAINNLTAAQQYTIANIRNTLSTSKRKQYKNPHISNLLYMVPLTFFPNENPSVRFTNYELVNDINKRKYFGPITLRKFHIRLLNENGIEIKMNDMDWSFSIVIEQLYNNT